MQCSRWNIGSWHRLDVTSVGAVSTWGPVGCDWTVSLYLRLECPVTTFGAYMGVGSMTLLSSPTVGVTVAMPTAGSIPTASGLDGVLPGWPWDAALVNQWRLITVVNQGSTGVRTLLIDGHEASSTTASVATIPAATVLSVCPASAVTLAEFMVWNTASITADQLASQAGYILGPMNFQLKWSTKPCPVRRWPPCEPNGVCWRVQHRPCRWPSSTSDPVG